MSATLEAQSPVAARPAAGDTLDPSGEPLPLSFVLPPSLEAHEPPEARGLSRDGVRLLVSYYRDDSFVHARFRDLVSFLQAGDLLVINTSGTLAAALPAARADGSTVELHFSTHLPGDLWTVELRRPSGSDAAAPPFLSGRAGERLNLPGGARLRLLAPYASDRASAGADASRLWIARLELAGPVEEYLGRYGHPIHYAYVERDWPLAYYQTVYATEPGSAEMPSAGRAFSPEIITALVARGVGIAPLILHTGVASLEASEPPYEEYYRVPSGTARAVNSARAAGGRVVAVGTTVVRALETVADENGLVHPGQGWTGLVITPSRGVRAIDGVLTGWHEPRASHLAMLEAIAGRRHLEVAYRAALEAGYLWHEFGDLHLILPSATDRASGSERGDRGNRVAARRAPRLHWTAPRGAEARMSLSVGPLIAGRETRDVGPVAGRGTLARSA